MKNPCPVHPLSKRYDVVVAGAGPVGLFLASELCLRNLSVLVLEQAEDSHTPLKQLPFGLRGLSIPTVEAFDRRGLFAALARSSHADHTSISVNRPGGHFAGIPFLRDDIDTAQWTYRLPGMGVSSMAVEMGSLESALADRAVAMGVEIMRGVGFEGLDQLDDHVVVHAGGKTFRSLWLVGCDGGRSTVRKAGGFDFVGTDPEFTGYSVNVEMADPEKLSQGRHYTPTGMYTFAKPGTVAMIQFDGGALHRTRPITIEHVQEVLRHVSGTDVTLTALRLATTWTDRACQATAYRIGRVLLAGDAAHIHSPLGGQGLNLGLGDAMNLGWKLASTIHGKAPEGLLESYFNERHSVGAQVLDWSRAQVALMRPSPSTRALETITRDLIGTRDGATYFAERVWGLSLRYDLDAHHNLVGRSVADFAIVDGTTPGGLLRSGKGLLLDFDARPTLRSLAGRWDSQITYVGSDAKDRLGLNAVLVRPDGIVAWVSEGEPDLKEAFRVVSHWFGEPDVDARPTASAAPRSVPV